jgi:hypothetical protein
MARIYEALPPVGRLQMALQVMSPTRLAQTFATFVGQFYDRSDFDTLARQVSDIYNLESAEDGEVFRAQLDRRLCDRCHARVTWEVAARTDNHVA